MPELSHRVQTFTDSVIRRMTRISDEVNAINLSQGFPDFPPPKPITDRLREVADEGPHQYSVTFGAENFREALARKQGRAYGRAIDPDTEILVTCGGTEAMMSAMMTVCNPGDKVIVFSPSMRITARMPFSPARIRFSFRLSRRRSTLTAMYWKMLSASIPRRSSSAIPPIPAARSLPRKSCCSSAVCATSMTHT